jgi:type I restriction enzyme, S subunit
MMPLPRGWAWATVDDLARYVNGVAFKPSDWEQSGRPIIRIQNLTGKAVFNHTTRPVSQDVVVREGDILVSWSATLDVFVWRGPEAVLNQHIFRVIPASSLRDRVFLKWALKNAIEELWASEHSHGTTMKHVNRGPFLAHRVKLPPAPEQRRVSDALESYFTRLDDAVASLERVQRNLKRYRASVLKAAVEGRLVPTEAELARAEGRRYEPASVLLTRILAERRRRWEEAELAKMTAKGRAPKDDKWKAKYVEPVEPDTSELPELPEGWCWATVDQLAHDVRYGSSAKSEPNLTLGVPVLRMGNVVDGSLSFEDLKYLPLDHPEFPELLLEPGDLLFNRTNSPELVGKTAVFRTQAGPCSFASYLIRVRFHQDIEPNYVAGYINSYAGRAWIASVVSQQVGQANVNGTKLKACAVPLAPANEQRRIVREADRGLSLVSRVAIELQTGQLRCTRLRLSILKWAFEGRLVDQDPTDEPASVLLDRIRAERASATDKPPRRARSARAAKKQGS